MSIEFGVSRSIIREAVKVLAAKGFVDSRPKIGARVLPRSNWNLLDPDVLEWRYEAGIDEAFVQDLIDVRRIVEPAAAERAALRASAQEITGIEGWYRQMEATSHNSEAFIAADMEFHAAILRACHNELLRHMTQTIGAALRLSRRITIATPNATISSLPMHLAVVEAIAGRDSQGAHKAMLYLVNSAAEDIQVLLKRST